LCDKFRWTVFLLLLLCDDDISPFIDVLGRFWRCWWCWVSDDRYL